MTLKKKKGNSLRQNCLIFKICNECYYFIFILPSWSTSKKYCIKKCEIKFSLVYFVISTIPNIVKLWYNILNNQTLAILCDFLEINITIFFKHFFKDMFIIVKFTSGFKLYYNHFTIHMKTVCTLINTGCQHSIW